MFWNSQFYMAIANYEVCIFILKWVNRIHFGQKESLAYLLFYSSDHMDTQDFVR
jgi:hypothetical protein